jgi:ADP-ribose pyrophosphatase YjhB (NUDIX family)
MLRNQKRKDCGAVLGVVFDVHSDRIVLVMEPRKPLHQFWKFPADFIESKDSDSGYPDDIHRAAINAVRRIVKEKTGLEAEVVLLGTQQRKGHVRYLYMGAADFSHMAEKGSEGEIPDSFSVNEIENLSTFLRSHRSILMMAIEKIKELR